MTGKLLVVVRFGGFAVNLIVWRTLLNHALPPGVGFPLAIVPILAVFPTVWLARRTVDASPSVERTAMVTGILHFLLMLFLGSSVIEAIEVFRAVPGWVVPVPLWISGVLLGLTGIFVALTVVNLALAGLGAPFAIALSKRLATAWMYSWTRNPMVLATLAFLVVAGLYLRSLLFVSWALLLVSPAWLYAVRVYEERELEIRFGPEYQLYKETTPFLWPRRPKRSL
jgi:protein-S-isoprenylcysteine O-methyltransferase Ste14